MERITAPMGCQRERGICFVGWLSGMSLRWKGILLVWMAAVLPLLGFAYYAYDAVYWLEVRTAVGGLMNFVDAKQQGVIRFLGQNEKLADQLSVLAEKGSPETVRSYFKALVEKDIFQPDDHPFAKEIKAGTRKIPTWRTYHAIDFVSGGVVQISSDPSREKKPLKTVPDLKSGYSDVYLDGETPVITFGARAKDGMVYVHADARMLTNIVTGEIGNMEKDMGAFYLAGVGKTFDYYIVNRDNVVITDSRVFPDAFLKRKGSEFPWKRTLEGARDPQSVDGKYTTNAGITTGSQEAMGFYPGPDGKLMLGASMPFYDSGWTIVVEQEADEILGPLLSLRNNLSVIIAMIAVALLAIGLLAFASLFRRVAPLSRSLEIMAEGNLRVDEVRSGGRDEIGQMVGNFNKMIRMIAGLRDLLEGVRALSSRVLGSAEEIAAASNQSVEATLAINTAVHQVAAGANQQASGNQDAVRAMEQLEQAINHIATGAREQLAEANRSSGMIGQTAEAIRMAAKEAGEVAGNADQTLAMTRSGGESIAEAIRRMELIRETSAATADQVRDLGEKSQQIGQIVEVISGIADQTNLLALNAAIEAARAGEHGRGFAVVAEEVRKLAERSQRATGDISRLIETIRSGVFQAVEAIEHGNKEIELGTEVADQASQSLKQILEALEKTNQQVQAISQTIDHVAGNSADLVKSVNQVAEVAAQNASTTEDMAIFSQQAANAIRDSAAISEETAAVSEEVSSSIDAVNSSTAKINAAIVVLNDLAKSLHQRVEEYRI